jgi:hypothetical protein
MGALPGTAGLISARLGSMRTGTADAAAIHLPHRSGVANKPFAATVLRDREPVIIHLWRREQGWLTRLGTRTGSLGQRICTHCGSHGADSAPNACSA